MRGGVGRHWAGRGVDILNTRRWIGLYRQKILTNHLRQIKTDLN